ncbi:hypothetical protein KM176_24035 [Pseudooceanicola sp. CBS1P-1]|uniref:Uncharacterized protein n=1 Tax=Pseudooceanicola albus TaxID=2692189 RepID=A0A6L7GAS5_9RHOB|nr:MULTISPECIES: hypothetical protein [Pseudooceanicola]MBT9386933.1 hypothetical protein [Pseudooceanicola endophyticus]MXN21059.1 hypothetical protein [Pseudooceanicola albus]
MYEGKKQARDQHMAQTGIQVFRDLTISSDQIALSEVRLSLLGVEAQNWVHNEGQEANLKDHAVGIRQEDVLVFDYAGDTLPKATLTLWQRDNAYTVTNIVPAEVGELGVKLYNDLLVCFLDEVVEQADAREQLALQLTDDIRGLDTWTSAEAADALRRFSALANKSTTNSHPNDRERWEQFVIEAHRNGDNLPVDILMQWLVEVDGWDETSANKLAIEFEQGISLLGAYDANLRG